MVLVYLLIVVLPLICLHISTRYSEYGRVTDRIPGPPALPIIGNLLLGVGLTLEGAWTLARTFIKKYYPILKVWKITSAIVATCHADHVKTLLSCKKNITKSELYKIIKFNTSRGILSSDGSQWHSRRRIVNTAFTPELLDYYTKTVIKHAKKWIRELRCQSKDFVLNTPPEFLKFSMAVALEGLMGTEKIEHAEQEKLRHAFSEFSRIIAYRFLRPYINDWMLKFLPIGHQFAKARNVINSLSNKLLEERSAYHEHFKHNVTQCEIDKPKIDNLVEDITDQKQLLLITDVLLEAEKKCLIDRNGMCEEMSTILLAGFETTGAQMSFIIALLAENKKVQDLIRAEISEVIGTGQYEITINDVKKMDYLERCIKESMRLLPVAPHIGRTITETVEFGEYKVMPGTEVYISIHELHRDPNFWPEPEKFDPDRFLPENVHRRHKFSFVPFSAGLRNCIGQKLAMAQMKFLTAYLIHNFILEPVDYVADQKFELQVTMQLEKYRVNFIRIDR